jgi:hypothetical protein
MLVIKSSIENKVEGHQKNEKKTKEAKVKAEAIRESERSKDY